MKRKISGSGKRKIIGLDLDGVILDHTENRIKIAAQFGFQLLPKDTPAEIMRAKVGDEAYSSIKKILYEDQKLYRSLPLIRGAKAGLHYIKSLGMPYFLVSRRWPPDEALVSMKFHGLWPEYFDPMNTFFVHEKKDKDVKAGALGVTHFIDDEPSVIVELASVSQKFLFDPLHVYTEIPAGVRHVHSWEEFIGEIV